MPQVELVGKPFPADLTAKLKNSSMSPLVPLHVPHVVVGLAAHLTLEALASFWKVNAHVPLEVVLQEAHPLADVTDELATLRRVLDCHSDEEGFPPTRVEAGYLMVADMCLQSLNVGKCFAAVLAAQPELLLRLVLGFRRLGFLQHCTHREPFSCNKGASHELCFFSRQPVNCTEGSAAPTYDNLFCQYGHIHITKEVHSKRKKVVVF